MSNITVRPMQESLYRAITDYRGLHPGEVEIWRSPNDVESDSYERLRTLLVPEELARAAAFRLQRDRKQYVIGRGLLRMLLAGYLRLDPLAVRFQYTSYGKPQLLFPSKDCNIQFNIAHSGAIILFGFTLEHRIGVDIEQMRSDVEIDDISQRFFSASERQWISGLPPAQRSDAFFRCWTRKEAFLKGTGKGLSARLDSFDVISNPEEDCCSLETSDRRKWLIRDLDVEPGYAAAVALEHVGDQSCASEPRTSEVGPWPR
ncbi:MAG TPA: 4'-phosphopantetheinyl transferase superfamily protein [Terriglobales bacterium]|nr:4'-phosphopantetheinyl transferase superfamily protein [Terriglobales bacterium]